MASEVLAPPAAAQARPALGAVRVLCVTPLGLDGRGGIDRLYRYLRELPPRDDRFDIRYAVSRGGVSGPLGLLAFPWHLVRIARTLVTWRPDLVHINYANGGSLPRKLAIAWLARLCGRRVVVHLHCVYPVARARAGHPAGLMARAVARSAAHVVAIGERAKAIFVDEAGIPEDRVHVIANGVPDIGGGVTLPKRHDKVAILFAGELGPRKGPLVLVEALGRLRDLPDWVCTIAGNGDVEGCRAACRSAGIADRVTVTGWVSAETVHGLMRDADVLVLPSAREVLPMSLIEGAAAGVALLATPVGEVEDVVHDGDNGFIIDRDPDGLAGRLRELIGDRDRLGAMQRASRRIYEAGFRLEVFAERLRSLYATAARDA